MDANNVHTIKLPFVDLVELDNFFKAIGIDSQETCKNLYDRVYHDDYIYVETIDHEIYIFEVKRG